MAADWTKIKTEYITNPDTSYRELSQKYGVHYTNIAKKAKKEDWQQQRQQHINTVQTKAQQAVERKQVDRAARLSGVAEKLLEKVEALLETDCDLQLDTQAMKQISGVLKDIKEIQMVRSDADLREQEARIAKLRREAERDEDDHNKTVVVTIAGGDESWRK